ncbi:MAG: DMT family transporter [Microcoleus sp. PH2017_10_PVI_O_A]|uniref:DMT family transporter n=1 Tax=unclassified Microcoleus TaxID=2642155 RepID=UPI001D7B3528|nr:MULTISPECIES: DMT family transporter [unclassified Microcoleus]TAE78559.1 MAG: EamA family transporter [Oscillatoriales cyanobacterium]MCC3408344.1 DMT family transporter [Microcoleus sp. PH2017_10_PVI_O_A]MCC3462403.1 DMT family transporter [Microcoleus sp. PH2017_11_PCY_U_A]MCC3480893.1 DMT family transporter [Microcoleus sp. PH2017_12_PCY_D_A]MCC3527688.1 DMT family transporter [Microcoleus sp. PH2017_21_RUC_O_A]
MNIVNGVSKILMRLPSNIYLGIAVLIFASSNSLTRKIVEIGQAHAMNGRNPISLCNVLFVGNICALGLMTLIFHQDWQPQTLKALTGKDWISLTITGILSGAIAPALVFSALGQTNVTNIVLIGRLEPILTLILGVWLLDVRVNFWAGAGNVISLAGVIVTAVLGSSGQRMTMAGFQIGTGELSVAIAAIIGAISAVVGKLQLQSIPLGIFSIYRNILGTVFFFILANFLYGPNHFAEVLSPFLWQWMIVYAAIIVVTGKLCWLTGLKNATSTELNLANLVNPIAAIVMAYLILGEAPTLAQYLGGSLFLIGIIFGLIGYRYEAKVNRELVKPSPRDAMEMPIGFRGV